MQNSMYTWAVAALAALPLVAATANAGSMDGSSDIVCAVVDVVGCAEDGGCVQGAAKNFELPQIMILDAKKKTIRSAYESGDKSVSPVKNLELSGDHLILQGVENGRGWDVAINTKSGSMSASVVGDAVSILAFGVCTSAN